MIIGTDPQGNIRAFNNLRELDRFNRRYPKLWLRDVQTDNEGEKEILAERIEAWKEVMEPMETTTNQTGAE